MASNTDFDLLQALAISELQLDDKFEIDTRLAIDLSLQNQNTDSSNTFNYDNCIVVHLNKAIGKDDLKAIFSNKSITSGGEIENLEVNALIAFIYYKQKSIKEKVLARKKITYGHYVFNIKPYRKPIKEPSSRNNQNLPSSSLQRQSNEPDIESIKCPVCWEKNKKFAFQCGHGSCEVCEPFLKNCPLCRELIKTKIRLYD